MWGRRTLAMYNMWVDMRNWVSLWRIHNFYSIVTSWVTLVAVSGHRETSPANLRHLWIHGGPHVPAGISIWGQQLFEETSRTNVLVLISCKDRLVPVERLHMSRGQRVHPHLAVHAFTVVLLRAQGQASGTVGATLKHSSIWGMQGVRTQLRGLRRNQVQVFQQTPHDILGAVLVYRSGHFRHAGKGGRYLAPWDSSIDHVAFGLSQVIMLRRERRMTTAQRAGVGAGPCSEGAPRFKVFITVGVRASKPFWVLRTRTGRPTLDPLLQSHLEKDKNTKHWRANVMSNESELSDGVQWGWVPFSL